MIKIFFGNEPYLLLEEKKRFLDRAGDELSCHVFEDLSDEIWQIARQYPVFSDRNYILVSVEKMDETKEFVKYLEHQLDMTDIAIFVEKMDKRTKLYKKLKAMNVLQECNKLDKKAFSEFVVRLIAANDLRITKNDYEYFEEKCGYFCDDSINLFSIKNAVLQMCMSGAVDRHSIDCFCPESNTTKVFALSNVLFRQDSAAVFKTATTLLANKESPIAMMALLLRQFRLAYKASLFHEVPAAQLEKMLGVSKYQFQDAMKYPADTVKKAMDILQSGVHDIKTGNADADHVFLFTLSRLMDCIQTGC